MKSLYRRSFKTTEHNKETGGLREVSDQQGECTVKGGQQPKSFSTMIINRDLAGTRHRHRQKHGEGTTSRKQHQTPPILIEFLRLVD